MHQKIIHRSCLYLLAVAAISFAASPWFIQHFLYPQALVLPLPALVLSGVLFYRKERAVNNALFLVLGYLSALAASAVIAFNQMPVGYWISELRFDRTDLVMELLINALTVPFLILIWKDLTSKPVAEAAEEARLYPPKIFTYVVAGIIVASLSLFPNKKEDALKQLAIAKAKGQLGDGYSYAVTSLRHDVDPVTHRMDWSSHKATVFAYNDSGSKTLNIRWR